MQIIYYVPNFLTKSMSQPVAAKVKRITAKRTFHSPVGAFISLNVWQKLARYTENTITCVNQHTTILNHH